MAMRRIDVLNYTLAVVLVVASVPIYQLILERRGVAGTQPSQSQQRAALVRVRHVLVPDAPLPLQVGSEGGVRCWRGVLYRQTQGRWQAVYSPDGRTGLCQIRVEPVHPQNFEASD